WFTLMRRYAVEGVPLSVRDESPEAQEPPDEGSDAADRPLSFAYLRGSRTSPRNSGATTVDLAVVWFVLIAVLWTGYLVLEGFDFGVGMLLSILPRGDSEHREKERRVLINTIGPVWDGNEVWLLTAGGATFAAFPEWYATLFSGFYLPLLLILVALIVRGEAFEYRGKIRDEGWARRC